ncbi:MAG: toxin-antitoxin system HicB family antitoxin [Deltaproteobacteria bacterium]|nr:MAG: toxin-antitoxin system HicB family antitoxin [Deltaproteobacteria bacterium]
MNEITLQLPKTLHRNLEILAEREAVPLTQYIVYILTRQISEGYTVRVVPEEDVAGQRPSFDTLLRKWGGIPPSEADRIPDGREAAEPEADLVPEVVSKLRDQIARSKITEKQLRSQCTMRNAI